MTHLVLNWCRVLLALYAGLALPANAGVVHTDYAEAELVAETRAVAPGGTYWVALRLAAAPGWHTYWRNPGDSGLPTRIDWDAPAGVEIGALRWPYPEYIPTPPFASYGYHGEVLLLAPVTLPATYTAQELALAGRANWLVCREVCLPESAAVDLILPVAADPRPDPHWSQRFAEARARWPRALPQWQVTASGFADDYFLTITPPGTRMAPPDVRFFAHEQTVVETAAPQPRYREGTALRLELSGSSFAEKPRQQLTGVLVSGLGWDPAGQVKALAVDLPVTPLETAPQGGEPVLTVPADGAQPASPVADPGFAFAMLLAFVGGLILNLMPCVFPILSIKVLSFVDLAHGHPGKVRLHGGVFAAGVLVSFWLLLTLLLLLRAGGSQVGWGFQLQSPGFVIAMVVLMFLVGMNLLGLFEVGNSVARLAGGRPTGGGLAGSFGTGVLATAVATPCTAPFMGVALGYALTQPAPVAFAVFTALAVGMAAPYVLLAEVPALLERLPRPGPWLDTLRHLLAFPVLATAIWLLWVLDHQLGPNGLALTLGSLLALGFALWIYGRRQRGVLDGGISAALAASALLLGAGLGVAAIATPPAGRETVRAQHQALDWEPYSDAHLARLRTAGEPVLVDFTAAWCITCQVNKRVALHATSVVSALKAGKVRTLVADWTNYDEEITAALARFGRSGVPLYLYYPPGATEPVILPELLTPGILLSTLEETS